MKNQFRPLHLSRITGYQRLSRLWRGAAPKFFLTVLFFLFFTVIAQRAAAQCMLQPVSLDQRLQQSQVVAEGRILSQRTQWDDLHHNIYTIYTIGVSQLFKGNTGATLELAVPGGQLGNRMHVASNALKGWEGQTGVFMLIPTNDPISTGRTLYECYAAVQGMLQYDKATRSASGVYDKYNSVENELYPLLERKLGRQRSTLQPLDWNKVVSDQGRAGHDHAHATPRPQPGHNEAGRAIMAISGFSPTTVTAGTGTVLTITGSGFGSTQGTSYVTFKNANNGGTGTMSPQATEYISWSDTQIQVEVPSGAGTGTIQVVTSSTTTSSTSLTVTYNISKFAFTASSVTRTYFGKMINQNSSGGYTFQYQTDFAATSGAVTYFNQSREDWICATGLHWQVGSNTTVDVSSDDNTNVVRFDNGSELATGVLGETVSRYTGCLSGSTYYWYLSEIDMSFNDGTSWYYGTGTPSTGQYDFYSVVLHELGHAHQIGHLINSAATMHWSIAATEVKRTLASSTDIAAGSYTLSTSTVSANCAQTVMSTLSCTVPGVTISAASTTIAETGGSTTITATLSNKYKSAVTVNLALTGTATTTTDYTLSTSITIPVGSTTASITLSSVSDAIYEGNETVIVNVSSVTNGTESGTQVQTITITDDETAPTVTMTADGTTFSEAGTFRSITFTLSSASAVATTITLATSGTATYNTDYALSSGTTVTIAAGSTSRSIDLTVIDDNSYEGSETVIIDIAAVTNATESGTQQRTFTLSDDDGPPTVTLSTGVTSIGETAGSTTVTATLSAASNFTTTVNLSLSGTATVSTDYTLSTTITIPAGSTSASLTLSSVSDALDEADETVIIDITSVTNGSESGTQQRTVTITDDDATPTVSLSISNTSIGETAAAQSVVTVTLSAASGRSVSVTLVTSNTATLNTDYTLTTSLTIPAGSTTASTTLQVTPDALYEGNEYVTIDISSVTNATENGTQQQTLTINDDDAAPTVTLNTAAVSISETGGTATVTATLSAASALTTTITLVKSGTATDVNDYTLGSTTITIAAGSTSGSATVTAVSDVLDETDETVIIDIASVTNATESGTQQKIITITDDDATPTVTLNTAAVSVSETGGTATVTATLSAASGQTVTVTLAKSGTATDVTDYSLSTTTITIAAGSTSGSATVTAVSDALDEDDETVIIDIASVSNATESGTQQKTVTITDDDAAPTVTLSSNTIGFSEGVSANITATLSAASSRDVTVNLSFSGSATYITDYTSSAGAAIVIPAGSTSAQTTIAGLTDNVYEATETIVTDISTVTNGTESGTQRVSFNLFNFGSRPSVTLSTNFSMIGEFAGSATITATLSGTSYQDITVDLAFAGTATYNTDYSVSGTSIVIPAGSSSGSITVSSIDDALYEETETIIADISSVTNGTENGTQQVTTSISNTDAAPSVTISTSATLFGEIGGSATITATLSMVSGAATTVNLAFSGTATYNTDYSVSGTSIVIPAGSTSATITINSIDDLFYEDQESIVVDVSSVTNGSESGTQQITTAISSFDPAPTVTINAAPVTILENGGSVELIISLSAVSGKHTVITLAKSGTATEGTDYNIGASTITISAGSSSASVFLTAVNDAITEGDETVVIDIASVTDGTESGTQQKIVTISEGSLLPVKLSKFSATMQNCVAKIAFETTTEINSKQFEVQWSSGDNDWRTIATIAAAGNSGVAQQYNAVHTAPLPGMNYYRLEQIDNDGRSVYSDVLVMKSDCSAGQLVISPNPFSDYVRIDGITRKATVQLTDAHGRVLETKRGVLSGARFATAQFARGVYYLVVVYDNGERKTMKLIK